VGRDYGGAELTRDELVMSLANRLYILSRLLTARVDGWGPDGELVKALVAELVEQVREGIPMSEDGEC
jgi:hypothetical protein